jgi:hypothetical protein
LSLGGLALVLTAMAESLGDAGHSAAGQDRWQPEPDERWQYQLESSDRGRAATGGIDVGICERPASGGPCVFVVGLYQDGRVSGNEHTVNVAAVRAIHRRGAHAVCYVSAGTAERFRPDYRRYVRASIGASTTVCSARRSATGSPTSTG